MIVDTFLFNDEFDILDIRLEITKNYVDKWIVLEGNKTWSGTPKPYNLKQRIDEYNKKYNNRIELITLDIPEGYVNWKCENFSRESIQQGINKLNDNDVIIHSDIDEFLNPEQIPNILNFLEEQQKPVNCIIEMYIYHFNLKTERHWQGPMVAKKHMFKNPQQLYRGPNPKKKDRSHSVRHPGEVGWHWTWVGDDKRIKNKVVSCIETQTWDPEKVLSSFHKKDTASAINHKCASSKVEVDYPKVVMDVITKYPYWS